MWEVRVWNGVYVIQRRLAENDVLKKKTMWVLSCVEL